MIPLDRLRFLGTGLNRPECVLTHVSGWLFTADFAGPGGVALIAPDGRTVRHLAKDPPRPLCPNGIALEPGGSFLLAEIGAESGGVWRLQTDGAVEPVLLELDGEPLPPTNFVCRDALGRIWVTVSTRLRPRHRAWRPDIADGFIALVDRGGARIVADGLGYTNECVLSADGHWLYVNETFTKRLSRLPLSADGLGARETVAEFGAGTFPDGLVLDAAGGLVVTSIVSNRVIRIAPDGTQELWLEDADPEHLAQVEAAWREGRLERAHVDRVVSRILRNVSSLAFGGPGLRTAYLGCLLGERIACLPAPLAGAEPVHYRHELGGLTRLMEGLPA
jgi:sugar lactone lactonase YvrE